MVSSKAWLICSLSKSLLISTPEMLIALGLLEPQQVEHIRPPIGKWFPEAFISYLFSLPFTLYFIGSFSKIKNHSEPDAP